MDRFFAGPYASQHLDTLLDKARYHDTYVKITKWSAPGISKPTFNEAVGKIDKEGGIISKGYLFGLSWTNHWLKVEITIPEEARSSEQVICERPHLVRSQYLMIVEFDPSCEALIFSLDGTPLHGESSVTTDGSCVLTLGITGGPNTMKDGKPGEQEDRRVEHIIPQENVRQGRYEVIIEVTCNSMFGLGPYRYQTPDVCLPRPSLSLYSVYIDVETCWSDTS